MESLRSLSSRLLIGANDDDDFDHDPGEAEKKWAIERCQELSEYDEENTIIMWIKKIKESQHKQHLRLLVITDIRLFTARRGGSKKKPKFEVRREAHILALSSVQEAGLILHINFRGFNVSFECNDDDLTQKILGQLYKNYTFYNPGFRDELVCKWLDQYKANYEPELRKRYPVIGDSLAPWERPARAFKSWAYFYKEANKQKLSLGLKSILRRPLDDMVVDDERWLHTKSLGCQNPATIHGALLCVAFTLELLHGVEVSEVKGDPNLYFAVHTLLKYNTTLGSLILDGCATGPEWGGLMVKALMANPNCALKRYGLKNARIGDKGVNIWIDGNKKMQRHPTCIYLTKAGCSPKTMINFIQSLPGSAGGSSGGGGGGLEELDISENPLESKGTLMLANRLVKDFHNLKMLNVEKCNIDCPRLLTAIEQASQKGSLALEEINLSYNKMTQQDGLILSRILANTGTCAKLGIAGCGLAGQTIAACLASLLSNDNLQFYARLDVSDNNIGCEAAIMFASIFVLTDRIMTLKLNNCELTHEGMGYILMSLLTQPRLKLLEMDCNCKRSQWNSGKYHVNQMLRKLLEKCLNLESLSIKNDPERGYQVDLDHFLHALKTNDSLISLDISGNSMTSDNLAALKDVILRNQVLRELHWDQNNITSKHILGITHALKQNKALQIVQFPDKDFEKELLREKSSAKKMELQMIKKNFYRAVFENASTSGFQQSTTTYKRTAAKRGSFITNRPKNEVYKPQVGGNALGLPQFAGTGPNAMKMGGPPPPNPMNGGGGRPPPNPMAMGAPPKTGSFRAGNKKQKKPKKSKPPNGKPGGMQISIGGPPQNPMGGPPPNPMGGPPQTGSFRGMGGPPPNPMAMQTGSFRGMGGPPPNPMGGPPPQSGSFRGLGGPPPNPMGGMGAPPQTGSFRGMGGPPPNPMNGGMGGMPPPNPMQNEQKPPEPKKNSAKFNGILNKFGGGKDDKDEKGKKGPPPRGKKGKAPPPKGKKGKNKNKGPPPNPNENGMGNGNGNGPPPNPMNGGMGGMPPMGMGGMPPMGMGGMGGMNGMPPPDMMGMGMPPMGMMGMGGMGGMPPPDMMNMGGMPPPDMMGMGGMPPMGMMGMGGMNGMPPPDMMNMGGMGMMPPMGMGGMGGMPPPNPMMGGMGGMPPPNGGGPGMPPPGQY